VNCAASLDGKIALANRRPVRLSCDADHQRVHALRAECDAVIVGIIDSLHASGRDLKVDI